MEISEDDRRVPLAVDGCTSRLADEQSTAAVLSAVQTGVGDVDGGPTVFRNQLSPNMRTV